MVELRSLLEVVPSDFRVNGIASSPYCFLNETLYITYLTQVALGEEKLRLEHSVFREDSSPIPHCLSTSLVLPRNYFGYGTSSSLALMSNSSATEGMILGPWAGGIRHAGRHFFSGTMIDRHCSSYRHGETLMENLETLHINTRGGVEAITVLMALLAINQLPVGDNFENNIRTMGSWYQSNHPDRAQIYWRE